MSAPTMNKTTANVAAPKTLTRAMLSPDQAEAYDGVLRWLRDARRGIGQRTMTLGGYAGSGKSTLLSLLALELRAEQRHVALVAFTGKAASILGRKLGAIGVPVSSRTYNREDPPPPDAPFYCGTVHGLVYIPVEDLVTGRVNGWKKRTTLDRRYSLIIIDEASMVSDDMLEDFLGYDCPILAVGDHGQLPPVRGVGSLMRSPLLRLEKIHRQAEGNPIIALSKAVRETGQLDRGMADGQHVVFGRSWDLQREIEQRYSTLNPDSPEARTALFDKAIICYTNRRRNHLNNAVRSVRGMSGLGFGEQVICLKNRRNEAVFNGMRGLVLERVVDERSVQDPWIIDLRVEFPEEGVQAFLPVCGPQFGIEKTISSFEEFDQARARLLRDDSYPPATSWSEIGALFDFGYALTAHKAQGSQVADLLVIAERPSMVDDETWRRWMYTAVTRSSEKLTVLL